MLARGTNRACAAAADLLAGQLAALLLLRLSALQKRIRSAEKRADSVGLRLYLRNPFRWGPFCVPEGSKTGFTKNDTFRLVSVEDSGMSQ